ncbi:hypothetical protein Ciccas_011240, partial [Cichlidogyrus casuarinus]
EKDTGCKLGRGFYLENLNVNEGECPSDWAEVQLQARRNQRRYARLGMECYSDKDCSKEQQKCCHRLKNRNDGNFCVSADRSKIPKLASAPLLRLTDQGSVGIDVVREFDELSSNQGNLVLILQIQTCLCSVWNDTVAQSWTSFHLVSCIQFHLTSSRPRVIILSN